MHTITDASLIDEDLLAVMSSKVSSFLEAAGPDLAKATLRIPDIEINRNELETYGQALRNLFDSGRFKERLYYISLQDYSNRNDRPFIDILIEMKRSLLI